MTGPISTDYIRVNSKFSCRFELKNDKLNCTWSPHMPTRKELKKLWDSGRYHAARHEFLTEFATRTGSPVVCIDLPECAQ